jgi:hypothetical protein
MNIPANQITLRTQAGDFTVPMGTAPILINGKRGTTRHLRVGQLIHVERTLPTEGSTDYVTQFVRIMGSAAAPRVGTRTQRRSDPFTSSSFPDQTAPRNSTQRGGWSASRLSPVTVSVDQTELERPGVVVNGRTLLPVRELVEHLGGVVLWDAHQKSVWAAFPAQGRTIQMTLDAPVAHTYAYDGSDPHRTGRLIQVAGLDQPPLLMGGQVYAPVAATTEVAGARLFYRPETRQVVIVTRAEDTAHR